MLVKMRQHAEPSSRYADLLDVWRQIFSQMICRQVSVMRPFLILNATHHEHEDVAVRMAELRDQMQPYIQNQDDNFNDDVLDYFASLHCDDDCKHRKISAKWPEVAAESNNTMKMGNLMVSGFGGRLRMPVWKGQSVDRWNAVDTRNYMRQFHAEWSFPKWFLKDFEKLSASQSALKRCKQRKLKETRKDDLWFDRRFVGLVVLNSHHQLLSFSVEVGNYTVGFLWWMDRNFTGRQNSFCGYVEAEDDEESDDGCVVD